MTQAASRRKANHDNNFGPGMADDFVSKTRRKKEMLALQDLGEELVTLNTQQLRELALPDPLLSAVLEARLRRPQRDQSE